MRGQPHSHDDHEYICDNSVFRSPGVTTFRFEYSTLAQSGTLPKHGKETEKGYNCSILKGHSCIMMNSITRRLNIVAILTKNEDQKQIFCQENFRLGLLIQEAIFKDFEIFEDYKII